MNKYLFIFRKFLDWGNPKAIEDLNEEYKYNPKIGWWESFGW